MISPPICALTGPWLRAGRFLLLATVLLAGCKSSPVKDYVIPTQQDAATQFAYALRIEQDYLSPAAMSRRSELAWECIAAYRAVIDNFPQDPDYVPLAQLHEALIHDNEGRDDIALVTYEDLILHHPEKDYIQAKALYNAALIYDEKQEFDKALDYYHRIIQRFENRDEPLFKRIVTRSMRQYQRVRKR